MTCFFLLTTVRAKCERRVCDEVHSGEILRCGTATARGWYGAIQLADSIARLGIQQAGTVRGNGPAVLRAIQAMDEDASAGGDAYQSQTAILNKINAASVLGLRIAEQGTQFLAHTVEQLL